MKDANIKLAKVFKARGTPKENTNNQVNQKGNKKQAPKQKNYNKFDWKKVPPKQGKKDMKTINDKTYKRYKWYKA